MQPSRILRCANASAADRRRRSSHTKEYLMKDREDTRTSPGTEKDKSHPVAKGVGAAVGGATGGAAAAAAAAAAAGGMPGPVGAAVGAVAGAVVGALAGKG